MHWRRKWQPTPVFLPGESQGWGSMVGCRLWGRAESDTTEVTRQQHLPASAGDNRCGFDPWVRKIPWRRAWLPIPVFLPRKFMDRGAWQATVHRVTQSRTRLKRLSIHTRKNPFKKWLDLWQQFFSLRSSPPPSLGMRRIPSCVWTSLEGFCLPPPRSSAPGSFSQGRSSF